MKKAMTQYPTSLLKPILNMELIECPPRVGSVVLWRDLFSERIEGYETTARKFVKNGFTYPGGTHEQFEDAIAKMGYAHCPFCDTSGTRKDPDLGYYYCICWLLRHEDKLKKSIAEFGSQWHPQSIEDMKFNHMSISTRNSFKDKLDYIKEWMLYPDRWIMLHGETGTGKTHILNAIMAEWYPWAMYVVASDFEDKLRSYMNGGQDNIQRFVNALQNHPILVFDDLGIQYSTEWIAAKLDAVIEFRSRQARWWDSLMVVGTNIPAKHLVTSLMRGEVSRSGSRLSDTSMVWHTSLYVTDYRSIAK